MVPPSMRPSADPLGCQTRFRRGGVRLGFVGAFVRARRVCSACPNLYRSVNNLHRTPLLGRPQRPRPGSRHSCGGLFRPAPQNRYPLPMPSHSSRLRHSTSENAETDTSVQKPSWGSSPSEESTFVNALSSWLPFIDANYRSLIARRTVLVRQRTVVLSATHARQIANRSYTDQPFRKPAPSTPPHDDPALVPAELGASSI